MANKKAVFVCGSGGSGKSTISNKYFNDYSIIDVDIIYENLLISNGLGLKIEKFTKYQTEIANSLFEKSKELNDLNFIESINSGLNIVIDSIGRDFDIILSQRQILTKFGYETYMIMVYAELENCIERVKLRNRSYNEIITINSWYMAYSNISKFKKEFKDKFLMVFNDDNNYETKIDIFIGNSNDKKTII
jgi:dephospho-CoA kinase